MAHEAETFTAEPFTENVCQPPDESHQLRRITASLTPIVITHILEVDNHSKCFTRYLMKQCMRKLCVDFKVLYTCTAQLIMITVPVQRLIASFHIKNKPNSSTQETLISTGWMDGWMIAVTIPYSAATVCQRHIMF